MEDLIVIRRDMPRVGDTWYLIGDRIDIDELIKASVIDEATAEALKDQGYYAKGTPETARVAFARRETEMPWPPRGFTEAGLIERGWVDGPRPATPKKVVVKEGEVAPLDLDYVTFDEKRIPVGRYWLQPVKAGFGFHYTAADAEGRILRPKNFISVEKGAAFLEALEAQNPLPVIVAPDPAASTENGDAGTSEGAESAPETGEDDRDLRSGAGG